MLCIINIIHVYTCILARVQCIYMTEALRVLHFSAFISEVTVFAGHAWKGLIESVIEGTVLRWSC